MADAAFFVGDQNAPQPKFFARSELMDVVAKTYAEIHHSAVVRWFMVVLSNSKRRVKRRVLANGFCWVVEIK